MIPPPKKNQTSKQTSRPCNNDLKIMTVCVATKSRSGCCPRWAESSSWPASRSTVDTTRLMFCKLFIRCFNTNMAGQNDPTCSTTMILAQHGLNIVSSGLCLHLSVAMPAMLQLQSTPVTSCPRCSVNGTTCRHQNLMVQEISTKIREFKTYQDAPHHRSSRNSSGTPFLSAALVPSLPLGFGAKSGDLGLPGPPSPRRSAATPPRTRTATAAGPPRRSAPTSWKLGKHPAWPRPTETWGPATWKPRNHRWNMLEWKQGLEKVMFPDFLCYEALEIPNSHWRALFVWRSPRNIRVSLHDCATSRLR